MGSERIKLKYPPVKRDDQERNNNSNNNQKIKPGGQTPAVYQWLEYIESQEVKDFVFSQNEITTDYLQKCKGLDKIKTDLRTLSSYRQMSCPTEHMESDNLCFFMNGEGVEVNADSLYFQRGLRGKPKLLVSPNDIPPNSSSFSNTSLYLRMYSVSRDGLTVAYAFGARDSKWLNVRFRDIATGMDLPDLLTNVCLSDLCWTIDGKGILYSFYRDKRPLNQINHKIVFHRIGTQQPDDVVLVCFPNRPLITLQAQLSDCGELIFVYGQANESKLQHTHLFYGDFNFSIDEDYQFTPLLFHLIEGNGLDIKYITNESDMVYFRTNHGAPKFMIAKIHLSIYNRNSKHIWTTVIPEDNQRMLDWAVCVKKDYLMVCYLQHAAHTLELHRLRDGTLVYRYPLPIGTIQEYFGDKQCPRFYFRFTSFATPDCVKYIEIPEGCKCPKKLNLCCRSGKKIRPFHEGLIKKPNTKGYVVKQLFCVSPADNATIPIFVVHKKNLKLDGSSLCMIYAQGCFGVQVMPGFSLPKFAFMRYFEGIVAVVGVRGGGEYGDQWYAQGSGVNKENTYSDFITATEHLINLGYTKPSKLILEGEAFGGNLAAVCLTQRSDLYSTVIIHDGLLDMLRFHLFRQSQEYLTEFGNPEVEANFNILEKLSPVHNIFVNSDKYPAVMAIVGKGRSFAHPSNSYKFVAQLQAYLALMPYCNIPCLLRPKPSYTPGADSSELPEDIVYKIEERADIFAFLILSLGLKPKKVKW